MSTGGEIGVCRSANLLWSDLDDSLSRAYVVLSWVYTAQAKYETAVAAAERAIALDLNDADNYVVLANAFNEGAASQRSAAA